MGVFNRGLLSPPLFSTSWLRRASMRRRADTSGRIPRDTFEGLALNDLLYIDDGLQWSRGAAGIEQSIAQWGVVLQEYGLQINAKKCQLYCSPHHTGKRTITLQGELIQASDELHILGVTFRVGITSSELLAPLMAKARAKLWGGLQHLLRAKTPLAGRVRLMERILGGTVLWPLAALPMDASSLGLINSLQQQLCIWMMRVSKRHDETWVQYWERAHRGARAVVHKFSGKRWSTVWLERWWQFRWSSDKNQHVRNPECSNHHR